MNEKIYDFNGIIEYQSEVEAIIKSELLVMTSEVNFMQLNIDNLTKELASAQLGYQSALGLTEEENGSQLRSFYLNKINEITSKIGKLRDNLTRLNNGVLELETSWEEAINFLNNVTTAMKDFDGNFTRFTDNLEAEINNFAENIRNIKRAFIDNNARWYGGSPIFDVDFSISTEDILDNKLNKIDKFKASVHEFNNEMFGYDIETGKVNLEGSKLAGLSEEEIKGLGGPDKTGTSLNIPEGIPKSKKSQMDYRTLKGGNQKKLQDMEEAYTDERGFRRFKDSRIPEDAYMVAMGSYYTTGRSKEELKAPFLKITLENGNIFYVIIGDQKADKDTNITHQYHISDQTTIEHIVDRSHGSEAAKEYRYHGTIRDGVEYKHISDWQGNIIKIEDLGFTYFD